jgi:glutamine synthetase type III
VRLAPVETMTCLTAHEFYAQHPNAKSFPSMQEARAWQDAHGGQVWHVTSAGMVRRGAPQASAVQVLVAAFGR